MLRHRGNSLPNWLIARNTKIYFLNLLDFDHHTLKYLGIGLVFSEPH